MIAGLMMLFLGGVSAGSFYIPLKKLKGWSWESGWIINGLFAWIIAPVVVAALTVPGFCSLISSVGGRTVFLTWLLGFLWGIGSAEHESRMMVEVLNYIKNANESTDVFFQMTGKGDKK